jgi:histidine triad (HIT) family protein
MSDCIFCKIVAGEIPSRKVAENEHALAFHDINPEQPVHILVVPKKHYSDIADLSLNDSTNAAQLMNFAATVANDNTNGHFRLQFNTGELAGQTVFHVHAHILSRHAKEKLA